MPLLKRCIVLFMLACMVSPAIAATDCHSEPSSSPSAYTHSLCALLQAANDEHANFHAALVVQHGQIVVEQYWDGDDRIPGDWFGHAATFDEQTLHDVRSISKSVVGLLTGIAIAQGKIQSVDQPISTWLGDHPAIQANPKLGAITLRHLLTMSSGLQWNEDAGFVLSQDQIRMEFSSDMVSYVLSRPMAFEPGSRYDYNSGNTALLGAILERATGVPFMQYAQAKLFQPLGIEHVEWTRGRKQQLLFHAGLRLTARDLAKIGALILAHGAYDGRTIVPASYLEDSLRPALQAEGKWQYGYTWRMADVSVDQRAVHWIGGMGNGGQRLIIVPALDAVIVLYAGRYNKPGAENYRASNVLFQQLIEVLAKEAKE
ncbi:beta-lactamase family protein [Burkholderiaceae bacterium DAT-1]|nr:beta-lactamase family protein [Burkholderiaceae bacterium DAT-1]